MRLINRPFIIKLLVVTFVLVLWCYAFPYIKNNGAGGGYGGDGETTDGTHGENMTIENYIVEGAGHFFRAKKDIQELLEIVELQDVQGIDFENMNRAVDSALLNMNLAVDTYDSLIAAAEATPYNETVLCKLRYFNYFGYMWEHGLNWIVFNRVELYLGNGNITGVFKYSRSRFLEARQLLNTVKEELSLNKLPATPVFWQLNETFDEISLFGSYVARVFASL
jgi:hypothetical protein